MDRSSFAGDRPDGHRSRAQLRAVELRISYCPYRLLFRHPFGTAHGIREGTDSIFIRLEEDGLTGYGEVTLPPYLREKPEAVVQRLGALARSGPWTSDALKGLLDDPAAFTAEQQGCRAGLHMAWSDLVAKREQIPVHQFLDIRRSKSVTALVTIGSSTKDEILERILELPKSKALKVKVLNSSSITMLEAIKQLDERPLFLDANQGLTSVDEALALAEAAGGRLLAFEQPFATERPDLQRALQERIGVCVYGDESIQGLADLEQASGTFGGVNIKLMKCGGLDRAKAMADRATKLGMRVMLGSMSESSLGCTAMAHLAGQADIADLDGPWLIRNDPFQGIDLRNGELAMPDRPGIGAVLRADLPFRPIGA